VKFYRLVGDLDQVIQTQVDLPPDSLLKKNLYESYPNKDISSIILDSNEPITDVLSNGTLTLQGQIISHKIFELAQEFNLYRIQFVPLIHPTLTGYHFMFFNSDMTDMLDYEASDFCLMKETPLKKSILDIPVPPNRDGVLSMYREHCSQSIFKYMIPRNGYIFKQGALIEEYDAFRIGHFDKSFYISERFKNRLAANGITGWHYVEEPKLRV